MKRLSGTFSKLFDDLVRQRVGLASSRRHEQAKELVLGEAMRRAGVTDEAVYLALLKRDHREFDTLIADLTVPETYFFRDPANYELLRREVLPAIVEARGREHELEVWSAGCATGEEPYSLAMLLEQELLAGRSHVLGSDVSRRALARAERGMYSRWSMRATDDRARDRYFEAVGREYRLVDRIRERVRFQHHSLMTSRYPQPKSSALGFDLILCRNVMIYFEPDATRATAQRLARSLAEGGWLMLGQSDPLLEIEEWCDTVSTPCGLVYRRRLASQARPKPRRARSTPPPGTLPHAAAFPRMAQGAASASLRPASSRPAEALEPAAHAEPAPASEVQTLHAQVQHLLAQHGLVAAEAGFRELVSLHPLSAPAHLLHATLLIDLARDLEAELALRRALYLDRSLLVAQMLSATLLERRADFAEASRGYAQVAAQARTRTADAKVVLGDGLTHGALAELAEQRARAVQDRGKA